MRIRLPTSRRNDDTAYSTLSSPNAAEFDQSHGRHVSSGSDRVGLMSGNAAANSSSSDAPEGRSPRVLVQPYTNRNRPRAPLIVITPTSRDRLETDHASQHQTEQAEDKVSSNKARSRVKFPKFGRGRSGNHSEAARSGETSFTAKDDPGNGSSKPPQKLGRRLSLRGFGVGGKASKGKSDKQTIAEEPESEVEHAAASVAAPVDKASRKKAEKSKAQALTVVTYLTGDGSLTPMHEKASSSAAPLISEKKLRQLKASLSDKQQAPAIVEQLKAMTKTVSEKAASESGLPHARHMTAAKGACLECGDVEAMQKHLDDDRQDVLVQDNAEGPFATLLPTNAADKQATTADARISARLSNPFSPVTSLVSSLPSPGKTLGGMASQSGAFDALAGVTSKLIDASGAHDGIITPPDDRLSVFVYWWGYELVMAPPTIMYLSSVHSTAGTLLTFLQAVCAGGAPELTPFIRYLSMYVDMEWKSILTNNKGKGVVLAATWVLPVAVVARPWDF